MQQNAARNGAGSFVDAAAVMQRLVRAGRPASPAASQTELHSPGPGERGISAKTHARTITLKFDADLDREQLEKCFAAFLNAHFS